MRAYKVKVRYGSDGRETLVEGVRATGRADAMRRALWRFLPGAEALWADKDTDCEVPTAEGAHWTPSHGWADRIAVAEHHHTGGCIVAKRRDEVHA